MKVIKKVISSLGTINEISLYCEDIKSKYAKKTLDEIEKYLYNIDDKWSVFKANSEISKINANSKEKETIVSNETFEILKLAKKYGKLTDGAFDITIYPVSKQWKEVIKENKNLDNLIKANEKGNLNIKNNFNIFSIKVDYNDIILNEKNNSVMLKNNKQEIELGGIAKGYVLDKIIEKIKNAGFKNALVNLGGTISSIGEKRKIGIRNPFTSIKNNNSKIFAEIEVIDEKVVTSGIYEQYVEKNGKVYHHIINPFTKCQQKLILFQLH